MIHWEYIEVGKLNAILTEVILSALLEAAFPKENKKMAEGGSAVREAINQGFGKCCGVLVSWLKEKGTTRQRQRDSVLMCRVSLRAVRTEVRRIIAHGLCG